MGKVSSTAAYLAVGFIGGLFAWLSGSQAATVEDAAKSEGEVVLYSSLNNEQIVTLVDAFKKKYPLIKPSFYRATSERVLQRALNEARAGRYAVDVFTAARFQLQLLKEAGLTQKFVSNEAAAYDQGFKDPEGHWINVHSLLNTMGYNTQLVRPDEAPKKYQDLLAPKWKGKIGVNLQDPEWYVNLQRRMGKEKAREVADEFHSFRGGTKDVARSRQDSQPPRRRSASVRAAANKVAGQRPAVSERVCSGRRRNAGDLRRAVNSMGSSRSRRSSSSNRPTSPISPLSRGREERGLDGLNVLNNLNYKEVKRFLQ